MTDPADPIVLEARVVEYEDGPDECTMFPRGETQDVGEATKWISAAEGSFVDLADLEPDGDGDEEVSDVAGF